MFSRRAAKNAGRKEYTSGIKRYKEQKYAKAERILRQSVQQREKVLGAEHKDTLRSKHWLARTLYDQQKYTKAEPLLQQLVQQQENMLGVEHKDTLHSKHWLARTLYDQQKYTEAKPLFQQLVQQRENMLGIEHKDTLESKYWLGCMLYDQQKYTEAKLLFQQLVEHQEKLLGVEHIDTLWSKYLLGRTLYSQQNYTEAKLLFQQLVEQQEKVLGVEHIDTLWSKHLLGRTLHSQQKYAEAKLLFQQLVQQQENVLGIEHRDTLQSKYWLACILYDQKNYTEAKPLLQLVVQKQEKVLGVEHKDTLWSKHLLGCTLQDQQNYTEAEPLFQQLVQQREKVLGVEHRDTLQSKYRLGRTLYSQQKYTEAEPFFQQLVQKQENVLGVEHENTLWSRHLLGRTLHSQQKYTEAEPLLQHLVWQREKVLGAGRKSTLESKRLPQIIDPLVSQHNTVELVASRLGDYFVEGNSRARYTDSEIYQISLLLKQSNSRWSKVPRSYIILRIIGCLSLLDTFIDFDYSDHWFPFTERNLPDCLRPSYRSKFVAAQDLVMTKSMDLEKGEKGQHCYFRQNEPLPFEEKGFLGSGGGGGEVDKVLSLISFKEYARKRIDRKVMFRGRKEDVKRFITEIETLKRLNRLNHRHVVEFVGSYTDPKYIGLIMSPVAEMDLSLYLMRANSSRRGELRTFFGCLARALEFLHEHNVRHKDIKPGNILVHNGNILFTDFGLAFDFTDAEGSTSVSKPNGFTPRYCAPEVAMHEPRNTSSDIWSLGVVFFEMIMVLKGRTVKYLDSFFQEHGLRQAYIRTNPTALLELIAELRGTDNQADNIALRWVQEMLQTQQQLRPTAATLVTSITSTSNEEGKGVFCGICCVSCNGAFLMSLMSPKMTIGNMHSRQLYMGGMRQL